MSSWVTDQYFRLYSVPWDNTTQTPLYNPLEKLPVLIDDTGTPPTSVYESHFILEWLETKYPPPKYAAMLSTTSPDDKLFAKQVEVLCDGMCDALVLLFFEKQRSEGARSKEWMERQMRKVDGGLRGLSQWVGEGKEFLVSESFGLADVAAGSVLGYMKVRFADHGWQEKYPALKRYSDRLEKRESFKETVPRPQAIMDKIV